MPLSTDRIAGIGPGRSAWMPALLPLALSLLLLLVDGMAGAATFHLLVEIATLLIELLVFITVWHTGPFVRDGFLRYLGIGYLWVGLFDGLHLLTAPDSGILPVHSAGAAWGFWLFARLLGAAVLFSAFHWLDHRLKPLKVLLGGGLLSAVVLLIVGHPQGRWMAAAPTLLHPAASLLIAGLLLGALVRLLREPRHERLLPAVVRALLASSILLSLAAELAYQINSADNGPAFLAGHLLRMWSIWMIYQAIAAAALPRPFLQLSRASRSYDAIPLPALTVDAGGRILQANRAAAEMAGVAVDDLQGQGVHEHFHAPGLSPEQCELCQAIAAQRPMRDYILYLETDDRWFQLSLAPLSEDDASLGMVQTLFEITRQIRVSRDLTETLRKSRRVEEALLASEEKYRLLVDNATEIILVAQDGCICFVNPKIEDVLGYAVAELEGQPFLQFVHEEDRQLVGERHAARLRGEPSFPVYSFRVLHCDGSIRHLEIKAVRIDWEGRPATLNFLNDITERRAAEAALRESEARFRNLFEHTDAIPVQGCDEQRRVIYWNPASEKLFGYRREQALGRPLEELVLPEHQAEAFRQGVRQWLDQGQALPSGERELVDADGQAVPVFISHVLLEKAAGQRELYCIEIDLRESKRVEGQLRILSQALEQSPVAVMITDTRRRIEYVNRAFEEITGYRAEQVIGQQPSLLESPGTPAERYAELWQALSEGRSWKGELESRRRDGERYWEYAYYAPVMDESGRIRHYLAVSEDISLRKQQQQRILHQAHFDALTDLPNRFLSLDRLDHAIREARRSGECVALLFLDLDDFKKINDTLGHEAGDQVLVEAGERLRRSVRSGDTVGRLGGDEFVVLLGGLSVPGDALPVVENLMARLREPYRVDGRELVMSVSIGIAAFPQDGEDVSDLLRKADSAMYHAKGQGRNAFSFFTEEMNREVSYRLALEEQIHGALDRNEFRVVYQPSVDLASGAVVGAEALLRWRNPQLGQVPPDAFIPVAEQSGMIVPLGQFVLQEALAMAARQRRRHPGFRIAVNLSPRQFRDPNLVDEIDCALQRNGLTPEALELEITEGVLMSGHSHIDDALLDLTALGVRIAMDDFGTGYSSLSYLREYPFDVLKIDRSFVRDIAEDAADRELITASIAMAHGLGLEVVAEGVETDGQRAFLRSQRCDRAQGYLFGKPCREEGFGR